MTPEFRKSYPISESESTNRIRLSLLSWANRRQDAGDAVDTGLRVFQHFGSEFLKSSFPPTACCLAAIGYVQNFILPTLLTTHNPTDTFAQLGEFGLSLAMAVFVGGSLFLLGTSRITTIVASTVARCFYGVEVPVKSIDPTGGMWRTFATQLLTLLLSSSPFFGFLALFVITAIDANRSPEGGFTLSVVTAISLLGLSLSGLWFVGLSVRYSVASFVGLLEDLPPQRAIRRSIALFRSSRGHSSGFVRIIELYALILVTGAAFAVGINAALGLIDTLIPVRSMLSALPTGPFLVATYALIPSFLIVWLLIPIWATLMTVNYFDRRIRLEGFDIEMLTKEIQGVQKGRFDL